MRMPKLLKRPAPLPDNIRINENRSFSAHIPVTQGGGKIHVHELSAGRYFVHFTQNGLKFDCSLAELSALGQIAVHLGAN